MNLGPDEIAAFYGKNAVHAERRPATEAGHTHRGVCCAAKIIGNGERHCQQGTGGQDVDSLLSLKKTPSCWMP